MTLENLLNSTKLFFDRKIGGEEYCAIFQEFYEKYFNYELMKKSNKNLADLIEEVNEDVSRFESNEFLRKEQADYYLDEKGLIDSVARILVFK